MSVQTLSFQIANHTTTLQGDASTIHHLASYLSKFPAKPDTQGDVLELDPIPYSETLQPTEAAPNVRVTSTELFLEKEKFYTLKLNRNTRRGKLTYINHPNSSENGIPKALWSALKVYFSVSTLNQGGLFLHASAVNFGDNAALFAGKSGAGKSTIAAMFPKAAIINDDIVALLPQADTLCVFSTPFTSTENILRQNKYQPLGCGFTLVKSKELRCEKHPPAIAHRILIQCAIVPSNPDLELLAFERCHELATKFRWAKLEFPLKAELVRPTVEKFVFGYNS